MTTYSQPIFKHQYGKRRNIWIVVEHCTTIEGYRAQSAVATFTTERAAHTWRNKREQYERGCAAKAEPKGIPMRNMRDFDRL